MSWTLLGLDRYDLHRKNLGLTRRNRSCRPCEQQQAPTYRLKVFDSGGSTFSSTQTTGNTAPDSGLTKGTKCTCMIPTSTDASVARGIPSVTTMPVKFTGREAGEVSPPTRTHRILIELDAHGSMWSKSDENRGYTSNRGRTCVPFRSVALRRPLAL